MKTTLLLSLVVATRLFATPIDLGPNGSSYLRFYDFSQLNGTSLAGQTVSLDLIFSTQVHLFEATDSTFELGLTFLSSGTAAQIHGSGFVLDAQGQRMCANRYLASATDDMGETFVGILPLCKDETGAIATDLLRPTSFYGVHFDLTLPDTGDTITQGLFWLTAPQQGEAFRVGPHIPDTGSTLTFLAVALIICEFARRASSEARALNAPSHACQTRAAGN